MVDNVLVPNLDNMQEALYMKYQFSAVVPLRVREAYRLVGTVSDDHTERKIEYLV